MTQSVVRFLPRYTYAGRSCHDRNVRLSVDPCARLSVKRVNCDKTKQTYAQIFIPYEGQIQLVF